MHSFKRCVLHVTYSQPEDVRSNAPENWVLDPYYRTKNQKKNPKKTIHVRPTCVSTFLRPDVKKVAPFSLWTCKKHSANSFVRSMILRSLFVNILTNIKIVYAKYSTNGMRAPERHERQISFIADEHAFGESFAVGALFAEGAWASFKPLRPGSLNHFSLSGKKSLHETICWALSQFWWNTSSCAYISSNSNSLFLSLSRSRSRIHLHAVILHKGRKLCQSMFWQHKIESNI